MHKSKVLQTFAAGLLAWVAIACTDQLAPMIGDAMVDAGQSIRDGSSASAQPIDGDPAPRWVLMDRDGRAVRAHVQPAGDSRASRFGDETSRCVYLERLADQFVGLRFDLATGQLGTCGQANPATWRDARATGVFANQECGGRRMSTAPFQDAIIDGAHWYTGAEPQEGGATMVYEWSEAEGCQPVKVEPTDLYVYQEIPEPVRDALPDGPYTLRLVY